MAIIQGLTYTYHGYKWLIGILFDTYTMVTQMYHGYNLFWRYNRYNYNLGLSENSGDTPLFGDKSGIYSCKRRHAPTIMDKQPKQCDESAAAWIFWHIW